MANILDKVTSIFGKTTTVIDETAAGNLGAVTQTAAWKTTTFILYMVIGIGIIFLLLILFYKYYLSYNKKVLVKKLKGSSVIDSYMTQGKIHRDKQGREKLEILRPRRKACPVPPLLYTSKMGSKDFYEVYMDEDGNLRVKTDIDIEALQDRLKSKEIISPQELTGWWIQDAEEDEKRFKSKNFFEKHASIILVFAGMVAVVAMVWITMNRMSTVASSIAQLADAVKTLR